MHASTQARSLGMRRFDVGKIEERGRLLEIVEREAGYWLLVDKPYICTRINGNKAWTAYLEGRAWYFDNHRDLIEAVSERYDPLRGPSCPYSHLLEQLGLDVEEEWPS